MTLNKNFICKIYNDSGEFVQINLPTSHPACFELTNTLCSVTPVEWIGKNSHNKIFRCTQEFKTKIKDTTCKYNLLEIDNFINNQPIGKCLAFLREGGYLNITPDLETLATYMVGKFNFLDNYNIISYGDKEVYIGPTDLKKCVCRFCKKGFPDVRFKKKNAHAIPDALGNKLIFCNDECMECNSALNKVDKELTEYLKIRRSEYRIPNKQNRTIQVYGHNFFYDGASGKLEISKLAILDETEDKYYLKLEGAEPITHLGIYKSLAKVAIDLMPRELVNNYSLTIDWIRGKYIPLTLPNVFFAYNDSHLNQPQAKVFVKKPSSIIDKLPRCIVALTITDLTFIYIVPLGDKELVYNDEELFSYLKFLIEYNTKSGPIVHIEYIDMEDRDDKVAHIKKWINKNDCKVVEQKNFNHTLKRSPNQTEFPPFDISKATINKVIVSFDYISTEKNDVEKLKIEASFPRIINHIVKINDDKKSINGLFIIEILSLCSGNTVLRIQCDVTATYDKLSDICSIQCEEISPYFVEFMLNAGCIEIGQKTVDQFSEYDFPRLASYLMEVEGSVLHPKKGTEQSIMNTYQPHDNEVPDCYHNSYVKKDKRK